MEEYNVRLNEMLRDGRGKYFLINVMSRRARALTQGARPAVPYQEGASDAMQTAVDEMAAGKLSARLREALVFDGEDRI